VSSGFPREEQSFQFPSFIQTCVPHSPQYLFSSGMQHSSTLQSPQSGSLHEAFFVLVAAVHTGSLVFVPLLLHPHASFVSGFFAHTQSPESSVIHSPVLSSQLTVLFCVPHSPQLTLSAGFEAAGQSMVVVQLVLSHPPQLPPSQLSSQLLVAVPPVYPSSKLLHSLLVSCVWLLLPHSPVQLPVSHFPILVSHVTLLVCVPHPLAHVWLSAGVSSRQLYTVVQSFSSQLSQLPPEQSAVQFLVAVPSV
jgi:hypothetical protein